MAAESGTKPRILLISLNQQSYFDEKAEAAVRLLPEQPAPSAVLISDEGITLDENSHVWDAVLRYVRQGGRAVIMGTFSNFVKNVAAKDAWYVSDENSVIESRVFAPENANKEGETAVAFASVGDGKLGYTGDVNAEKATDTVILAMCGLL